ERAGKIRILGSVWLSVALTRAGGFDVVCAPLPMRVFDMAASLLLLGESGGVATTLQGEPLGHLRCDLATRSTLLCAPTRELHSEALQLFGSRPCTWIQAAPSSSSSASKGRTCTATPVASASGCRGVP